MQEEWREIPGYEKLYEVSTLGKIRKYGEEHMLLPTFNEKGYFTIHLRKNKKTKFCVLHRLVAQTFPEYCGEWFDECVVHHKDHNRINNCVDNLKVLSREDHSFIHRALQTDKRERWQERYL